MLDAMKFMEMLWRLRDNRRFTVLCGDGFGDGGKGGIEAAIQEVFDVFVRVSGGANTGRTRDVLNKVGEWVPFIFHLLPTGIADGKTSVMGDWVLVDIDRFDEEITSLTNTVGPLQAPLYMSKRAPVMLPYYALIEAAIEMAKGDRAIKTTKRGIGPTIASVDLRIAPRVGDLFFPDTLRGFVEDIYNTFEPIFRKLCEAVKGTDSEFNMQDIFPDRVISALLAKTDKIKDYVTDVDPILHGFAQENRAVLLGLTQGYGLNIRGTYPYCSTTQTVASAAAFCGNLPMKVFGPTILVSKLDQTRVGDGPFPAGWWDRKAAEVFPKERPELFSILEEHDYQARETFLSEMRAKINSGEYNRADLAKYFMVLLNELGATTKRGREVGGPDLYMTGCAADVNGADCIALTRVDMLSNLKFRLPIVINYAIDGVMVERPNLPMPCKVMESMDIIEMPLPIDSEGVDLCGVSDESQLPHDIHELLKTYENNVGVPVGIVSTSAGTDGKIFREITA